MYKTVVFDLDGTLLNTIEDLAAAANYTLRVLNMPRHKTEDYKKMVGSGIENLVKSFLPQNSAGPATVKLALHIFSDYYSTHMVDLSTPYPGIKEMLQSLVSAGVKLAVLSNKAHEYTCEIVQSFFPDTFSAVQGLCDDYQKKPDPASLIYVLQQLEADPETTLYCGDSDVDMQTAKNAGLRACGVLWGFREKEELIKNGADVTVFSAEELEKLILL